MDTKDYHSNVDTSRPFRSVKEAVAVFGERLLAGELYPQTKPFYSPPVHKSSWAFSPSPQNPKTPQNDYEQHHNGFLDTLKKLKAELEETKMELKLLKERECETEVALASLNAELHKNMSKLAEAEAKKAAAAATRSLSFDKEHREEEVRRREIMRKVEESQTLAQILSIKERSEGYFGGTKEMRKMRKKKPIVPLVGDLFFKKKGSSNTTVHNPLYASPHVYFN